MNSFAARLSSDPSLPRWMRLSRIGELGLGWAGVGVFSV